MQSLLSGLDIFFFSAHWLHDFELNTLRDCHSEFYFYAVASPQVEGNLYCVPRCIRGHGGAGIAWRTSFDWYVKQLTNISSHRIVGIQIQTSSRPLCILSVYLPTRSGCTDEFRECLDQIDSILEVHGLDSDIIIMGDMNADMGPDGGPYWLVLPPMSKVVYCLDTFIDGTSCLFTCTLIPPQRPLPMLARLMVPPPPSTIFSVHLIFCLTSLTALLGRKSL